MLLEHLEATGVRNLERFAIDLSPGLNAVVGSNGSGKTALLEAVYLLGRARSFRTHQIATVIGHHQPSLTVHGRFSDPERGTVSLGVSRDRQKEPTYRVNGESTHKASRLAALLPIQLLLPDVSELVLGSPAGRRRFLDWGVFHVKHTYLEQWRLYKKTLQQRNSLLKKMDPSSFRQKPPAQSPQGFWLSSAGSQLSIWTERLAHLGMAVDGLRKDYLQGYFNHTFDVLKALKAPDGLNLSYYQGWKGGSFEDALRADIERDIRRGATHSGPHKSDLVLEVGGSRAATQLSRGQAKTVAHSMHLAQALFLQKERDAKSLFLIDDVAAELDEQHAQVFFELLYELEFQVLSTSVQAPEIGHAFRVNRQKTFHVKQGIVSEL